MLKQICDLCSLLLLQLVTFLFAFNSRNLFSSMSTDHLTSGPNKLLWEFGAKQISHAYNIHLGIQAELPVQGQPRTLRETWPQKQTKVNEPRNLKNHSLEIQEPLSTLHIIEWISPWDTILIDKYRTAFFLKLWYLLPLLHRHTK